jgi:hypothetical protein
VEYRPGETIPEGWENSCTNLYRSPWCNVGFHGNMGTVIIDHPALGQLAHEGWCDLNFAHLIHGAYPILLEDFHPECIEPIIRSVGHYRTMVDKAYLFEMAVGQGALLATSLKFDKTYETHPETRYLAECLLSYAAGDVFKPERRVSREKLSSLIQKPGER